MLLLPAAGARWARALARGSLALRAARNEEPSAGAGCEILGVEICEGAQSVAGRPFARSTAFMLGNEVGAPPPAGQAPHRPATDGNGPQGSGLSAKQLQACDRFVYIPQFGPGTASLNVVIAASIVLHEYAAWAGYLERPRQGQKYVVDARPQRTAPRGGALRAAGRCWARVGPTPRARAGMVPRSQAELHARRRAREGAPVGAHVPWGWGCPAVARWG